jgi:hypothetical protein
MQFESIGAMNMVFTEIRSLDEQRHGNVIKSVELDRKASELLTGIVSERLRKTSCTSGEPYGQAERHQKTTWSGVRHRCPLDGRIASGERLL